MLRAEKLFDSIQLSQSSDIGLLFSLVSQEPWQFASVKISVFLSVGSLVVFQCCSLVSSLADSLIGGTYRL